MALIAAAGFSCGRSAQKPARITRPVEVYTVETLGSVSRNFAGVVTAENYTNLAFPIPGQLLRLNVDAGQRVTKGEVIAELDPRDYQLKVDVSRAELETAQQQLIRNERLYAKQAVSKQDYEIAQTRYVQAKAAYDNAVYNLNDTKLDAPFAGIIEQKYVENFQTVSVGQSIVKLVDPKAINVEFILPENSIDIMNDPDKEFSVEFDNYKGKYFKASLKEYVEASSDGSGVPVTLYISDTSFNIQKYRNISPGFSALVYLKVQNPGFENVTTIPLTAVFSPADTEDEYVWAVNDSRVEARRIKTGQLYGQDQVIVETGLRPGEKIVTAGVYQLVEGQQVTILK